MCFTCLSAISVALTLLAPASGQFLFNLLSFIVFLGLYQKKSWAVYPGIVLTCVNTVFAFYDFNNQPVITSIGIAIYVFMIVLLFYHRDKFSNKKLAIHS